jgi:hypothetical protein
VRSVLFWTSAGPHTSTRRLAGTLKRYSYFYPSLVTNVTAPSPTATWPLDNLKEGVMMSRNPSEARGGGANTAAQDGGIAAGVGDRDTGGCWLCLWLGRGPSQSRPCAPRFRPKNRFRPTRPGPLPFCTSRGRPDPRSAVWQAPNAAGALACHPALASTHTTPQTRGA